MAVSEARFHAERESVNHSIERMVMLYGAADAHLNELVAEAQGKRTTARLVNSARSIIRTLRRDGAKAAGNLLIRAYVNGADVVEATDIREGIHREALNILTDSLVGRLDAAAQTAETRTVSALRRQVLVHAQAALVERGDARNSIESRLANALRDEGITAFTDRAGRQWKLETYARMAVRTEIANAQAQATINRALELGVDLVRVSDHNCSHHPNDPLHPCRRFEGQTFALTGDQAPRLPSPPPWHPNCTHYLLPTSEALAVAA